MVIPHLKALYKKYHEKGFEIVGISLDEYLDTLAKGLEKHRFPWTILADEKLVYASIMTMCNHFAVNDVPCRILVGRDGKILSVEIHGEALDAAFRQCFPTEQNPMLSWRMSDGSSFLDVFLEQIP